MISLRELKQKFEDHPSAWKLYLMDFVDEFRYARDVLSLAEPFPLGNERVDALLASTAEYLCDEQQLAVPPWLASVPACRLPWFVAGVENLKAIALAESPLRFRIRKIFVLANFLDRARMIRPTITNNKMPPLYAKNSHSRWGRYAWPLCRSRFARSL